MSSKNLPEDLIIDILSRLPVKSLLRFRCVSKPWCTLITDPSFIKMHLNRSLAINTNLTLIYKNSIDFYSVDLDAWELNHPLKSQIFRPSRVLEDRPRHGFIGSFDLTDEEYQEMPSPDIDYDFAEDMMFLMKVGVLGGQLCLVCNFRFGVEIWMMKDYGVRDSWVKPWF
ncbi:F-box protein CPR1-like [Macadamia integrifolia]|uniref:F-box protein CPR1-like n=1 Tax=Macadamia integrifolia TaxID=60698 RepID=UPI001C4E7A64|nr:F-box protein CPR1-like [Macadamia integrifolia]